MKKHFSVLVAILLLLPAGLLAQSFDGLDNNLSGGAYFLKLVSNIIDFARCSTGLYRFISSDPINIENISDQISTDNVMIEGARR